MADWYDFDKKMALINLNQIHEYAVKLDNIVTEETELEEWVKMKLTRIEQNVADVKKSLEGWEKFEEFGEGGRIFKKQLLHIAKYAKDLIAMIKLGSKLMSWQENKLAVSAEYIDAIYHHLDYKMGNRASDIKFANGGGIKTDLNELKNTELRNVLISFWNDFFNNHIGNYLSIEKENYVLSNIDNVFVIVRDKDKGNFSDVEKQKIDRFLSPYFDSNKKPLFTDFFNNYEIKDNKIIIYIKDIYANGGRVKTIKESDIKVGAKFELIDGEIIEITRLFKENIDQDWCEFIRDGETKESSVNALKNFINNWRAEKKYANGGEIERVFYSISNDYVGNLELGSYYVEAKDIYYSKVFFSLSEAIKSLFDYLKEGLEYGNNSLAKNYPKSKFQIYKYDTSKKSKNQDIYIKEVFSITAKEVLDLHSIYRLEKGGNIGIGETDEPKNYYLHAIKLGDGKIFRGRSYYDIITNQSPNFFNRDEISRGYVDMNGDFYYIDLDEIYANGGGVGQYGGVGEIKAYKTKTGRLKKDTNGRILFIMPDGSQKYFFSVDWAKDYWSNKDKINKSKYANGGGVGDYSEYSNDALKDMIINLSRYENTEGDIKIIKEELERRKSMYFVGGSVNEISKNQLENMVGKKLDGWNDDIVYYGGKKYQKCYLRPYYKVC